MILRALARNSELICSDLLFGSINSITWYKRVQFSIAAAAVIHFEDVLRILFANNKII